MQFLSKLRYLHVVWGQTRVYLFIETLLFNINSYSNKTLKVVQYLNLFVSNTCLVWDVCCCGVCSVNASMLICCHCLSVLDSNDTESIEEGEVFEYQEEEQGQAIKTSHLFLMHI
jgi:hypothetical protein